MASNYAVEDFLERLKAIKPLSYFEKFGISSAQFTQWKKRNTFPRADDLFEIAKDLDVSIEYLLTGKDSTSYKDKYDKIKEAVKNIAETY